MNIFFFALQGCFWHGCASCYDGDTMNPVSSLTMGILNEKTAKTTAFLRSIGYTVVEKWEHEFQNEKKHDKCLKSFLDEHIIMDRLNPRDSFFGGRTNATTLFYEGKAKYIDFTSLYPWVRICSLIFFYVSSNKLPFFHVNYFFIGKQILFISSGTPQNHNKRFWGYK